MHRIVWRFVIRDGASAEFERHYGPDGTWAELFRRGAGYVRTDLFRSVSNPREYVTIDVWDTAEAFFAFRERYATEYEELDRQCADLTELEELIGCTPPNNR